MNLLLQAVKNSRTSKSACKSLLKYLRNEPFCLLLCCENFLIPFSLKQDAYMPLCHRNHRFIKCQAASKPQKVILPKSNHFQNMPQIIQSLKIY